MTKRILLLVALITGLLGASNWGGVTKVFAWHGGLNQPAEQCVEGTPRESFTGTVFPATGTWNVVVRQVGYSHNFPFQPNSDGSFSITVQLPVATTAYTASLTSNDDAHAVTNIVTFNVTSCYVAPTATPTNTPTNTPTKTNTPVPPTNTVVPPTNTVVPPTSTPTNTVAPPTNMPTNTVAPPTSTSTNTVVPPTSTPTNTVVPPTNTVVPPTNTPTNTVAPPTSTPTEQDHNTAQLPPPTVTNTAPSVVQGVQLRVVTKIRYHDKTRYHDKIRYHDKTRYHDVTRFHTRVKTVVRYRTLRQVKTVTRVKRVTMIRVVVNHKVVYTPKVRYVTVVRYHTRVVITHRTIVSTVVRYHFQRQPKTGRLAGPMSAWHGAIPAAAARMSIARLGISWAPVWSRDYLTNADGSLSYDIVPAYGVTRFQSSAAFGQPGLTLLSGHDDIGGSIFRALGTLQRGDVIRVWQGKRAYRYVVSLVGVVTPDDVRLLNLPRTTPTLALISCTPYMVDTHRVVVIAEMR